MFATRYHQDTHLSVNLVSMTTLLSVVIGGLIVWKHRGNLQRLAAGTESKFHFHRS